MLLNEIRRILKDLMFFGLLKIGNHLTWSQMIYSRDHNFNVYTDSSYHASIIKFYGVYYKYDLLNWILIQLWIIFGDKQPNKVQSGMEGDIEDLLLDISDLSFVLKTIVKSHTSYYSVEIQFNGLESTNIRDLVDKIVEFESRIRSGWKLKSNSIVNDENKFILIIT